MSKAELFQQLETLSREELDQVADRVDVLRYGEVEGDLSQEHRTILEERIREREKNPRDLVDLDEAVSEILKKRA